MRATYYQVYQNEKGEIVATKPDGSWALGRKRTNVKMYLETSEEEAIRKYRKEMGLDSADESQHQTIDGE